MLDLFQQKQQAIIKIFLWQVKMAEPLPPSTIDYTPLSDMP